MAPDSIDAFVRTLANRRRRTVVRCLDAMSPPVSIADLVDAVREYEAKYHMGRDPGLKAALHHRQLPKLEGEDIISVDFENGRVEPDEAFPVAREAMETGKIDVVCRDCGTEQTDSVVGQQCGNCGSPRVSMGKDGGGKMTPNSI